MKKPDRINWIIKALGSCASFSHISVLDEAFVDAYIKATDAPFTPTLWGAHKCPQLGRDLGDAYREGFMDRGRVGVCGGYDFPTSILVYHLNQSGKMRREMLLAIDEDFRNGVISPKAVLTRPASPR